MRSEISRKEIGWAFVVVGFAYLSLTRWVPAAVQNITFPMVILLDVVLNAAGWRGLKRMNQDTNTARWRQRVGLLGLLANTLAIALPLAGVLYGVHIEHLIRRGPVNASDILDVAFVMPAGLALAAFGLVAGMFAPSRIRLLVILGAVITFLVISAIPLGIL